MFYGRLPDERGQLLGDVRDDKTLHDYLFAFSHNNRFFGVRLQFLDQIKEELLLSYTNRDFSDLSCISRDLFVIFFITFKAKFNRFLYVLCSFFNCFTLRNTTRNCRTLSNNIPNKKVVAATFTLRKRKLTYKNAG